MSRTVLALGLVLLFLLACFGWGRVVTRLCRFPLIRLPSFSCVLGIAILGTLGGVLNALRMAKAPIIVTAIVLGAVFGVMEILQKKLWGGLLKWSRETSSADESVKKQAILSALPTLLAIACGLGACILLMPTFVFNFHDDFYAYLTRVQRMLQTGSLGGNAFDGMGLDSLGSQSFLQGFFVAVGGTQMANGFDAVFCFFVSLWLIADCARAWRIPMSIALSAILTVAAINPQYVNVSPLYSSVLATMALVLWGSVIARQFGRGKPPLGMEIIGALLAAWLISLKATVAPFAIVFLVVLYGLLILRAPQKSPILISGVRVAMAATVFLLPWLLTHASTILRAQEIYRALRTSGLVTSSEKSVAANEISQLFSAQPLFYGNTITLYQVIIVVCVAAGVWALSISRRRRNRTVALLSVTAATVAVLAVCVNNAHLLAVQTALRLSIPVLIGCSALPLLLLLRFSRHVEGRIAPRLARISLGILVGITFFFMTTAARRIDRALQYRTLLSFPINKLYADYCRQAMSHTQADRVREIQKRIPSGAQALVWTATPFQVDFTRNKLHNVTDPGVINPALHLPVGASPATFDEFLAHWKIAYVILDVAGMGAKTALYLQKQKGSEDQTSVILADLGLYLRSVLEGLTNRAPLLYADESTWVLPVNRTKSENSDSEKTTFSP